MKGSYALLMHIENDTDIRVGSLGKIHFPKGDYIYIGSALNGIEGRVRRHKRKQKKIHWHIDYFLNKADIKKIYFIESPRRLECLLAENFNKRFEVVNKFGSSDCSCKGHLFYGEHDEFVNRYFLYRKYRT